MNFINRRKLKTIWRRIKREIKHHRSLFLICLLLGLVLVSFLVFWLSRQKKANFPELILNSSQFQEEDTQENNPKPAKSLIWQSFGDSFSSLAYLDQNKTNMFFDDKVTALIFPPVFEFVKTQDCSKPDCNLSDFKMADETNLEKPKTIPAELRNKKIVYSRLDKLNSVQIASFIVLADNQENVYSYFFDDKKFSPIINGESSVKLETKYSRGGGKIAVSGDDDNFLILYIGYEGLGVHYNKGAISDISDFFGLRVSDSGFTPLIVRQGIGDNSLWYILSLDSAKPKLIKLWQNNTKEIVGAHDFSNVLLGEKGKFLGFSPSTKRGELNFIFQDSPDAISLYKFSDHGFDNSLDRVARSVNVDSSNLPLVKAKIKSLGLFGQAQLFLGDSDSDLVETQEGAEVLFEGLKSELFWQINFPKSDNNEYSPWLDHINYLDYYLADEGIN